MSSQELAIKSLELALANTKDNHHLTLSYAKAYFAFLLNPVKATDLEQAKE